MENERDFRQTRFVAFIIDLSICFLASLTVTLIPFVNNFLPWLVVFLMLFLIKDGIFDGRGLGKNILKLKIVDSETSESISYKQSIIRNGIIIVPILFFNLIYPLITPFIKNPQYQNYIYLGCMVISFIYFVFISLAEAYKIFYLNDTVRLGDKLAHTEVIEDIE